MADLNDCTTAEIREVLKRAGYRFGRGGNPVKEPASSEDLPVDAKAADVGGLPTQEQSLMDTLEKEINKATDQLRAADAERERLEAECARLRKICSALNDAKNALKKVYWQ